MGLVVGVALPFTPAPVVCTVLGFVPALFAGLLPTCEFGLVGEVEPAGVWLTAGGAVWFGFPVFWVLPGCCEEELVLWAAWLMLVAGLLVSGEAGGCCSSVAIR